MCRNRASISELKTDLLSEGLLIVVRLMAVVLLTGRPMYIVITPSHLCDGF